MITFEKAKKISEECAENNLRQYCSNETTILLREDFMKPEFAILFFRNKSIEVPPGRSLSCGWSYAGKRLANSI